MDPIDFFDPVDKKCVLRHNPPHIRERLSFQDENRQHSSTTLPSMARSTA